MQKIAIIGSGLSASYLAYLLKSQYEVHCFDKARGVGGRAASKRASETSFDHGLSYFKIENSVLKDFLEKDEFQDVIASEQVNILTLDKYDSGATTLSKNEYYTSKPFGNSFCKKLLQDTPNQYKSYRVLEIKKLAAENYALEIELDSGNVILDGFTKVISTAPNIQTAELTKNFPSISAAAKIAEMSINFVVLISAKSALKAKQNVLDSDILRIEHSPIAEIIFNHKKAERDFGQPSIVIKANKYWSKSHLEIDTKKLKQLLIDEFISLCGVEDLEIDYSYIHRWLYSETLKPALDVQDFDQEKLFIHDSSGDEQIYACGDWAIGFGAEKALLSAKSLADYLLV